MGGQRLAPAALLPGEARYPLYGKLGGTQDRSGRVQETSPQRNSIPGPSRPQTVTVPIELSGRS